MRVVMFIALMLSSTLAWAGNDSVYTELILEKCQRLTPETSGEDGEGSGIFKCEGHAGIPVYFGEGDLRSFVSFGGSGEGHCASSQTFSGFNSVGNKIEWRLKDGKPIATIFRWSVSYDPEDSSKQKSWLVVTKLDEGNSCHMGYVEGGYPNANEKARWLADTAAEVFSCKVGKTIFFAKAGTAIDGIASEGGCE